LERIEANGGENRLSGVTHHSQEFAGPFQMRKEALVAAIHTQSSLESLDIDKQLSVPSDAPPSPTKLSNKHSEQETEPDHGATPLTKSGMASSSFKRNLRLKMGATKGHSNHDLGDESESMKTIERARDEPLTAKA